MQKRPTTSSRKKTTTVSLYIQTRDALVRLKLDQKLRTMEDVIRWLIRKAGVEKYLKGSS